MKVQASTFQLQVALNNSATSRTPGPEYLPGKAYKASLNLEALNLRNVYLNSKGDIHVSNHGWSRMWAGLLGRKTGEAALRESMSDRFKFSPQVIDRAMAKITGFKAGQSTTTLEEVIHQAKHPQAELTGGFVGTSPVAKPGASPLKHAGEEPSLASKPAASIAGEEDQPVPGTMIRKPGQNVNSPLEVKAEADYDFKSPHRSSFAE